MAGGTISDCETSSTDETLGYGVRLYGNALFEMGDGTGFKFLPMENKEYPYLSSVDKEILDTIIQRFGKVPTSEIVELMHQEDAYIETAPFDIVQFKYAQTLSVS